MKVSSAMPTYRLLALLPYVKADLRPLKKCKPRFRYRRYFKIYIFPDDVLNFTWGFFCQTQYMIDYRNIVHYLSAVTGYNEGVMQYLPVNLTYGLWQHYAKQYNNVLKTLEEINAEIPSEKQAKDMSEFGLTNITDFLSRSKNIAYETIEGWSIYRLIAEYKREVYHNLNIKETLKPKDK